MGTRLVFIDQDIRQFMSMAGLCTFEDFVEISNAEIKRQRATSTLQRTTLRHNDRTECVYVKTYDYTKMPLLRRIGAEKAEREAENYLVMRDCGVTVPELVGYGSHRRFGLLHKSFLITRACKDCSNLEEWLATHTQWAQRRRLLIASARQISLMHSRGFFHIDLQFRNIMVDSRAHGSFDLVLLDSPRGGYRTSHASREYGRLRDLSSLFKDARRFFSRTEMLRWFIAYTGTARPGPEEKLLIWSILRDRSFKDNPPA